jgi:hypothetical protein
MAARMKAQVRQHPVDHAPSVTAPDAVTDIILEAIRESGRNQRRPLTEIPGLRAGQNGRRNP